jgi:hypothetical protein
VEFIKLQKDYNCDKTMVLEITRFVASKHLLPFKKTKYFVKAWYFSNTLKTLSSEQGQTIS